MTETEMSSSAGSTTTPFLCRLTTSRTVLPNVKEDPWRTNEIIGDLANL